MSAESPPPPASAPTATVHNKPGEGSFQHRHSLRLAIGSILAPKRPWPMSSKSTSGTGSPHPHHFPLSYGPPVPSRLSRSYSTDYLISQSTSSSGWSSPMPTTPSEPHPTLHSHPQPHPHSNLNSHPLVSPSGSSSAPPSASIKDAAGEKFNEAIENKSDAWDALIHGLGSNPNPLAHPNPHPHSNSNSHPVVAHLPTSPEEKSALPPEPSDPRLGIHAPAPLHDESTRANIASSVSPSGSSSAPPSASIKGAAVEKFIEAIKNKNDAWEHAERARTQRAEGEAENKELASRLQKEADIPAFQAQIEDRQKLINHFTGEMTGQVASNIGTPLSPKQDVAGVPKLETQDQGVLKEEYINDSRVIGIEGDKTIGRSSVESHFVVFRPMVSEKLQCTFHQNLKDILPSLAEVTTTSSTKNPLYVECGNVVYDSTAAQDWIDDHQNSEVLQSIRSNCSLPILAMYLSTESPAISVFHDSIEAIRQPCRELAQVSGFPVVVRPRHEFPQSSYCHIQKLNNDSGSQNMSTNESFNGNQSSSNKDGSQKGKQKSNGSDGEDDKSDEESEKRGGGGGGGPLEPSGSKPYSPKKIVHRTNILLDVREGSRNHRDHFINVITTASFSPIPNKTDANDQLDEPEITGNVGLQVRLHPSMEIDDAYSSTGFLVKDVSFFCENKAIDQIPSIKSKYVESNQRAFSLSGTLGVSSGQPKASATMAASGQSSNTVEAAEDQGITSSFISRHMWTNEGYDDPERGSYTTVSHHIKRWPPKQHRIKGVHEISDLNTKYGLSVITAEDFDENSPNVAFVSRLQIHVWVTVEGSSTPRGIVLVNSNYIPDIRTPKPLRIKERSTLDLPLACGTTIGNGPTSSATPPVSTSGPRKEITPGQGVVSFGSAIDPNDTKLSFPKRFSLGASKIGERISRKGKGKEREQTAEVTIQRHVFRGWDDTTKRWYEPVWPELDENFRPITNSEHCRGAWTMKWKD